MHFEPCCFLSVSVSDVTFLCWKCTRAFDPSSERQEAGQARWPWAATLIAAPSFSPPARLPAGSLLGGAGGSSVQGQSGRWATGHGGRRTSAVWPTRRGKRCGPQAARACAHTGRVTLRWTDRGRALGQGRGGQAAGHPAVGSRIQKAVRSGTSCGASGFMFHHTGRMASCPSLGTGLRQGCPTAVTFWARGSTFVGQPDTPATAALADTA